MEACLGVERELNNVLDKMSRFGAVESGSQMEQMVTAVQQALQDLHQAKNSAINPAQTLTLVKTLQTCRETVEKVSKAHRDIHGSVSKVGKAIDRNFVTDYDSTSRADVFAGTERQAKLNEVILQHFYRHGRLDIGDNLAQEANLTAELQLSKAPFQQLNSILESLNRRDLTPALAWAAANRQALQDRGTPSLCTRDKVRSSLEMKLHKLQFIELLRAGNRLEAVAYARSYFPDFVGHHEREIQVLMGAVMFSDRLAESPYKHLLDSSLWTEIADLFLKDACALMGLSVESPLSVAVNAGCTALPALLNIKQVMQQRQVAGVWNNAKDELPIEIDLGSECRYHSIFACPILRQQTNDMNPPVRLTCGHCISRDALNKLSSGHKLKCPYCPVEQNPNDARQITF